MQCEAIVPEREVVRWEEGDIEAMADTPSGPVPVVVRGPVQVNEAVPGGRCQAEATMLARSMRERADGGWDLVEDRCYCPVHFEPGTMTHLDGRVTQHAPMAIEDA